MGKQTYDEGDPGQVNNHLMTETLRQGWIDTEVEMSRKRNRVK